MESMAEVKHACNGDLCSLFCVPASHFLPAMTMCPSSLSHASTEWGYSNRLVDLIVHMSTVDSK